MDARGCRGTMCWNGVLENPDLQDLGGGGGNFYAAGNLEAGDADDFSGGIAQHHYISFVQVFKLYIREVIGHLFAPFQSDRGKAVACRHRTALERHLYLIRIHV